MRISLVTFCLLGALCSASAWELNYDNCVRPVYNMANMVWFKFTGIMRVFRLTPDPEPEPEVGRCVSKDVDFAFKLARLVRNNDRDGDGVVEASEVVHDVSTRYDVNKDGVWTEKECVDYSVCALGDSTPMATYACNLLFSGLGREANVSLKQLAAFPPLQRRAKCGAVCLIFCSNGNILDTNGCPTCNCRQQVCGIPDDSSCEYGQEMDTSGCPTGQCKTRGGFDVKDFIIGARARYEEFARKKCLNKCISVEEKLALNARNNDFNNDGLVTAQDIRYDLNNFYDENKDGFVSKAEFVSRWICNYGGSTDFARFMWRDFGFEALGRIDINNLPAQFENLAVPKADFMAGNRERFARYDALTRAEAKSACEDAVSTCAARGLTVAQKVDIDIRASDTNNDGFVSRQETRHDLEEYYDINGDGVFTQRECENRIQCRFGDSTVSATHICTNLIGSGDNVTINDVISALPERTSVADWRTGFFAMYQDFVQRGCTDKCLTVEERVEKNARNNDGNNDGIVDNNGIAADLRSNYDLDSNNVITRAEFVKAWSCLYGTSADFARYRWSLLNGDNVERRLDNLPPEFDAGVSIDDWKALTAEAYRSYAENNPNAALDRQCRE